MLFHVVTCAAPWMDVRLAALDDELSRHSAPIHVDWSHCELEDADHFTHEGSLVFARLLVNRLLSRVTTRRLLILTDSTVDHNDWTGDVRHGNASRYIETLFLERGIHATVDAVRGSGFVALANDGLHFRPRLHQFMKMCTEPFNMLLVGGWNDISSGHSLERILSSVRSFVALYERGTRHLTDASATRET